MVLLALLLGMMGFVVWYVIDRRAKMRLPESPAAAVNASPVDLTQHDNQTVEFSSGRPVVKDTAEDRAAIAQARKDMAEAVKGVTFGPPAKKTEPLPPEPAKP